MSTAKIIYLFLSNLLLPPMNFLIPMLLAIFFRGRIKQILVVLSFLLAVAQSSIWLPNFLALQIERYPALHPEDFAGKGAQAIVVLGAGRYLAPREYGYDILSKNSLERVRFASKIYRATHVPILVTGGNPEGGQLSEGETMKIALENDFGIPVKWLEDQSLSTSENAVNSFEILKKEKIKKIILVSHAVHLFRAVPTFEHAGFEVIPAPLGFISHTTSVSPFLIRVPSVEKLNYSHDTLHEAVGALWYWFRGRL